MTIDLTDLTKITETMTANGLVNVCSGCHWFLARHRNGNKNLCRHDPPAVIPFMGQDVMGRQVMQTVGALPTIDFPDEHTCAYWKAKRTGA